MKTIEAKELKSKIDAKQDFKLIMTYYEWAYNIKHIPGSINVSATDSKLPLNIDDEIVVYCINEYCNASIQAYHQLVNQGFTNVTRFSGGISEWEKSGYTLEGSAIEQEMI